MTKTLTRQFLTVSSFLLPLRPQYALVHHPILEHSTYVLLLKWEAKISHPCKTTYKNIFLCMCETTVLRTRNHDFSLKTVSTMRRCWRRKAHSLPIFFTLIRQLFSSVQLYNFCILFSTNLNEGKHLEIRFSFKTDTNVLYSQRNKDDIIVVDARHLSSNVSFLKTFHFEQPVRYM
jgi:hypothetical protein